VTIDVIVIVKKRYTIYNEYTRSDCVASCIIIHNHTLSDSDIVICFDNILILRSHSNGRQGYKYAIENHN